jgi:hypothetical protein
VDVSKFKILPFTFKYLILLKPVLEVVGGSLHLTELSMKSETEPATF